VVDERLARGKRSIKMSRGTVSFGETLYFFPRLVVVYRACTDCCSLVERTQKAAHLFVRLKNVDIIPFFLYCTFLLCLLNCSLYIGPFMALRLLVLVLQLRSVCDSSGVKGDFALNCYIECNGYKFQASLF
jgi:hypothetical protein